MISTFKQQQEEEEHQQRQRNVMAMSGKSVVKWNIVLCRLQTVYFHLLMVFVLEMDFRGIFLRNFPQQNKHNRI